MNERIFELAEQALEETHRVMGSTSLQEAFDDFYTEKFAELIVRECCNVLQGEDILHGGYGYNQGFLHKKIKEHFGVEE
jgi:hypothetical protein